MKIAIYPGTFDPVTVGHLDIIKRAVKICDRLIVAAFASGHKEPLLDLETRKSLIIKSLGDENIDCAKIEIDSFSNLLIDYAAEKKAEILIRGLRAVSDFEYEFQMACMNSKLNKNIQTIFLPASEGAHFISSRFVKQIASLKGDISGLVTKSVFEEINSKYKNV